MQTWLAKQLDLAKRFRDHNGQDLVFANEALRNGLALMQAVFREYCEKNGIKPLPAPAEGNSPESSSASPVLLPSSWAIGGIGATMVFLGAALCLRARRRSAETK
jgi:hypothetical protein